MRHPLTIFLVVVSLAILAVGGYGLYWQHKLTPIMSQPQLKLVPQKFVPVAVGETRKINLGYATVSLPAWVRGDPVQVAAGVIGLGKTKDYSVAFFAPVSEDSAFLKQTEILKGKPASSFFAEVELALAQQPFSVWMIPKIGRRETVYRLTLLMLKSLYVGKATSVFVLERNGLGIIVKITPSNLALLQIYDRKNNMSQMVMLSLKEGDWREFVSAIADSYELHLEGNSLDSIKRQIEQAHIPPAPPNMPSAGTPQPLTK